MTFINMINVINVFAFYMIFAWKVYDWGRGGGNFMACRRRLIKETTKLNCMQGCHGHGKVMEFDQRILHIYKSPPLRGNLFVSCSFCKVIMELFKQILNWNELALLHSSISKSNWCTSIKRSWNFVIRSWKSHGILLRQFRGNPGLFFTCHSYFKTASVFVSRFSNGSLKSSRLYLCNAKVSP